MKICEYCKHWDFPTNSLYQQMRVEGFCTEGVPKQTAPGFKCEKHIYEQKSQAFHLAVGNALRQVKNREFGAIMNFSNTEETEVQALERKLAEAKDQEKLKADLADAREREFAQLQAEAKLDLNTQIDKLAASPQQIQIKPGDVFEVVFRKALTFQLAAKGNGVPDQMVFSTPGGKLYVLNESDVGIRPPK